MTSNTSSLEQASCSAQTPALVSSFLTSIVVGKAQSACESVAENLHESAQEHEILNDFLSACGEYLSAMARNSRHRRRYAAWCFERCAETALACQRLDDGKSRQCVRWCRLLMGELTQELDGTRKACSKIYWELGSAPASEEHPPWAG